MFRSYKRVASRWVGQNYQCFENTSPNLFFSGVGDFGYIEKDKEKCEVELSDDFELEFPLIFPVLDEELV